ncbi:MAG: YcfL family protein [Sedimentisphaerales bacterium]|nr:YcfL family protein [Sedimentisphaerales bacterium]
MKKSGILLITLMILACGCSKQGDSRIHMREGVGSDTLASNIVTRPVTHAFSALTGEGLIVKEAVTRRNAAGFLELFIVGYNESYNTRRFRYKVTWLDSDGLPIDTKTSTWKAFSATGKTTFSFKAVASRTEAVDFTMDTKKWE